MPPEQVVTSHSGDSVCSTANYCLQIIARISLLEGSQVLCDGKSNKSESSFCSKNVMNGIFLISLENIAGPLVNLDKDVNERLNRDQNKYLREHRQEQHQEPWHSWGTFTQLRAVCTVALHAATFTPHSLNHIHTVAMIAFSQQHSRQNSTHAAAFTQTIHTG